jgi:hypothetical protein
VIIVIIDTEGSFNWEHAKLVGFNFNEIVDEETGEILDYDGNDFMYFGGSDLLDYIKILIIKIQK